MHEDRGGCGGHVGEGGDTCMRTGEDAGDMWGRVGTHA